MNLMKSLKKAAAAVMFFSAGVANAGLYQFDLTGDYDASWRLDSTLVSDVPYPGLGFTVYDVFGNFPGSWFDVADLTFFNASIGGGMEILDWYGDTLLLSTDGLQLYTGSEYTPTFKLGTFNLTQYLGTGVYTLTVTDLDAIPGEPSPVPEPATTAMLLGGLGALYAVHRRRQR